MKPLYFLLSISCLMTLSHSPVSAMKSIDTFKNQVEQKANAMMRTTGDVQYRKAGMSREFLVLIGTILGGVIGAVSAYFGWEDTFTATVIGAAFGLLSGFILAGILALIFISNPTAYPSANSKGIVTFYNSSGGEIIRMDEIPKGYIAILLDLILLLMLLIGAYRGYKSGLVSQLFTTLAILVVLISGRGIFDSTLTVLTSRWPSLDRATVSFISFTLLLLILLFFVVVIEKALRNVLRLTFLGYFDSLLGAIVGFIQSGFFLAVLIWLLGVYGIKFPDAYTQNMRVYKAIYEFMPRAVDVLKGYVSQYIGRIQ